MFRAAVRVTKTTKEEVGEIYMQSRRPSTAYCIFLYNTAPMTGQFAGIEASLTAIHSSCGTSNLCRMNSYEHSDSSVCVRQLVDKYFS